MRFKYLGKTYIIEWLDEDYFTATNVNSNKPLKQDSKTHKGIRYRLEKYLKEKDEAEQLEYLIQQQQNIIDYKLWKNN